MFHHRFQCVGDDWDNFPEDCREIFCLGSIYHKCLYDVEAAGDTFLQECPEFYHIEFFRAEAQPSGGFLFGNRHVQGEVRPPALGSTNHLCPWYYNNPSLLTT